MKRVLFASVLALSAAVAVGQTPPAVPAPGAPAAPAPGAPAAPTPPPAPAATTDLYPLKPGSKWMYKLGDAQQVEIAVAATKDGETTLETRVNGKAVANETVKVQADGVYRTKVNGSPVTPPVKFLALPATKGAKWDVATDIQGQKVKGSYTIKEEKEKFKTKDGKEYEAVSVEGIDMEVAGTKTTVKQWFAPGKGLVKLSYVINAYEATIELFEYTEGK